ncbi:MAG: FHA domain-containing protein [Planctomycetota bacterium]
MATSNDTAYLRVISGPLKDGVFVLSDLTVFEIGRGAGCHVKLRDELCGLNHARISQRHGKWVFKNLSDERGSSINDIIVDSRALDGGEIIRIGQTELQFTFTPPTPNKKPATTNAPTVAPDQVRTLVAEHAGPKAPIAPFAAPPPNRLKSENAAGGATPREEVAAGPTRGVLQLTVIDGAPEDLGKLLVVDGSADLLIGRSLNCDMVLKDGKISRTHTRIELRDGQIIVTDLGSANGTVINGEAVKKSVIKRGDYLRLGFTVLSCSDANHPLVASGSNRSC